MTHYVTLNFIATWICRSHKVYMIHYTELLKWFTHQLTATLNTRVMFMIEWTRHYRVDRISVKYWIVALKLWEVNLLFYGCGCNQILVARNTLTPKQVEAHGCVFSNATIVSHWLLNHQAISTRSADKILMVLDRFQNRNIAFRADYMKKELMFWKKITSC